LTQCSIRYVSNYSKSIGNNKQQMHEIHVICINCKGKPTYACLKESQVIFLKWHQTWNKISAKRGEKIGDLYVSNKIIVC
jgi:hypothetical protein